MTFMTALAIVATATISATLAALFLTYRWGKAEKRINIVNAYDEQLKEIEKKRQSGEIDEAQADKARARILRKLASKAATTGLGQKATMFSRAALIAAVLLAPAIATVLATYFQFPVTMPAQEVLASSNQRKATIAKTTSADPTDAAVSDLKAYLQKAGNPARLKHLTKSKQPSLPGVDIMIKRLAARLESAPGNAEDWRMLGWSYFQTDKYREAVEAYARAVALQPGNASWQSEYGAALSKAMVVIGDQPDVKQKILQEAKSLGVSPAASSQP